MTEAELKRRLAEIGWKEGGAIEKGTKKIPNPSSDPVERQNNPTIEVPVTIYKVNGKEALVVYNIPEAEQKTRTVQTPSGDYGQTLEVPVPYQEIASDPEAAKPRESVVHPSDDALKRELQRQREANLAAQRGYLTDEEVAKKEADAKREAELAEGRSTTQANTAADNKRADEQLQISRNADARAAAAANKPSITYEERPEGTYQIKTDPQGNVEVSLVPGLPAKGEKPTQATAPEDARSLVFIDSKGNVIEKDNPNYNPARQRIKDEQERLDTAVKLGQITRQAAKDEFDGIIEREVNIPLKIAQEARARTAELREERKFKEERLKYQYEAQRDREKFSFDAGQQAIDQTIKTLPFMAGPKFGEQWAQGVNALAKGDTSGVNFTADAFEFDAPDFDAIARQRSTQALASISPLAGQLAQQPSRIRTQNAPMPDVSKLPQAPKSSVDWESMLGNYMGQSGMGTGGNVDVMP
jgi:hypothetical protein